MPLNIGPPTDKSPSDYWARTADGIRPWVVLPGLSGPSCHSQPSAPAVHLISAPHTAWGDGGLSGLSCHSQPSAPAVHLISAPHTARGTGVSAVRPATASRRHPLSAVHLTSAPHTARGDGEMRLESWTDAADRRPVFPPSRPHLTSAPFRVPSHCPRGQRDGIGQTVPEAGRALSASSYAFPGGRNRQPQGKVKEAGLFRFGKQIMHFLPHVYSLCLRL